MAEFPIKFHYNHIFYAFCDVITSRQQLFTFGLKYLCFKFSFSFKDEKKRAMLLQIMFTLFVIGYCL